jgi:hypothetical protein
MKKAILLIAVLLLVGSALYAEASFGIWGRTRFALAEGNNTLTLPQTYQDWNLWGNWGPQMQLNYSWSNDKMGYVLKYVYNGGGTNSPSGNNQPGAGYDGNSWAFDYYGGSGIQKAYGTLKLIPNLLTLHVGFMQDYDQFRFEGGAQVNTYNTLNVGRYNGWGLIAVLAPKDSGFVLAVQYRTEQPYPASGNGYGSSSTLLTDNLNNISVAAEFQLPDIFKVQAGLVRNGNKQGGGETYPNVSLNSETGAYNIFIRLHLLAIQGLTLNVTNGIAGLLESDVGWNNVIIRDTLYARFGIGAFAVAVGAESVLNSPKVSTNNQTFNLGFYVEPSYNLGPITLGLGGLFTLPQSQTVGISTTDSMSIQIQPWVLLNDFSTRIFFDFIINPNRISTDSDYAWDLKVDFTFSF